MICQVDGPHGQRYYSGNKKESDKFDFTAPRKGHYKFCFNNQSPMHETIDFDVHVGHPPKKQEDDYAQAGTIPELHRNISRRFISKDTRPMCKSVKKS